MTGSDEERPSKSQRKREHQALISLARNIADLPERARKSLALDESLVEPLQLAASMKPSGARERQLRYIAKLLENTDHAAIRSALEERQKPSRETVALHHEAESWRDRLIAEDSALDECLQQHPELVRSRLQTLVIEARQQAAAGKPPKAARQLFRAIREALQSA